MGESRALAIRMSGTGREYLGECRGGRVPVPAPILDSRQTEVGSPQEILARLERYAATRRSEMREAHVPVPLRYSDVTLDVLPSKLRKHRLDPSTIDLFPFDLVASIVGCAATIAAYMTFGLPIAVVLTAALVVGGEGARRRRWFPSLGVNLIIGTVVGLLFVFTA
jgi:hypothetical protein